MQTGLFDQPGQLRADIGEPFSMFPVRL
jgi:hypothetical protein